MDALLAVVAKLGNPRYEEDKIDWANYQLTAYMFAISSILITSYTYMGTTNAIKCWTPAEFRKGWQEYARDFCLIENTYYVAIDDPDMPDHKYREEKEIPYYQWVPFVLVVLAFLWYVPHLFWRSFNWWSGVQVRAIVKAAATLKPEEEARNKELNNISNHLSLCVFDEKRRLGASSTLTFFYFIMKALFIINIVFQIIILHIFLGFDWADLFRLRLSFNSDWKSSGLFPRTTMCDFTIRNKGNLQSYSIQCVLAQNMFNEKIFLVLFYWILFLFLITLGNTLVWAKQSLLKSEREAYVERMLASAGIYRPKGEASSEKGFHAALTKWETFVDRDADTIILLRLISSNAGDGVTSELLKRLYEKELLKSIKDD